MSKIVKATIIGLIGCMVISLCGFNGQCASIRDKVVRVHVLAHSDTDEDQALKLRVRDAVLRAADGMLDSGIDREDALVCIQDNIPRLTEAARTQIAQDGYDYDVTVSLCRMYFTTREYESGTLPAGMYDALRVEIGEAAGQNWWCVLYPTICLPASGGKWEDVLTSEETDIVEHPAQYTIGFKVVEWWEYFCQLFQNTP